MLFLCDIYTYTYIGEKGQGGKWRLEEIERGRKVGRKRRRREIARGEETENRDFLRGEERKMGKEKECRSRRKENMRMRG